MQPLSIHSAAAILEAFNKKQINLDEEMFDQCVDTLVLLLEQTNDQKYRLQNRKVVTLQG